MLLPLVAMSLISSFVELEPPKVFLGAQQTAVEMPSIDPKFDWDEAIVSWNVQPAAGAKLKVEARVVYDERMTKWYTIADWSLDGERKSLNGQRDEDGNVNTDTLSMKKHGGLLQLRLTGSNASAETALTFLGVSFSDTSAKFEDDVADRSAWGRSLAVFKRNQNDYPGGGGLCSPTSVSMLMTHWSSVLGRPEMNKDVPDVQTAVWDPVYNGAGNWPFNTAYAGSYPGIRSYVSRFASISELEAWTKAGFPVICSVSYQLLRGKKLDRATEAGHLVLLLGFTAGGEPVFNDPASRERPKVYSRKDFEAAWDYSRRTVYLAYPTGSQIPTSDAGRWAKN